MGKGSQLINSITMAIAPFPLLAFCCYMLYLFADKFWFQICGPTGIIISIILIIITLITILIAIIECVNIKKEGAKSLVSYYFLCLLITGFLVLISLLYTSYQKELEFQLYMQTYISSFSNSSLINSFNLEYKTNAEKHDFYHNRTLFVHDVIVLLYYLEILLNFIGRKFSSSFTNFISISGYDENDIENVSNEENPLDVPQDKSEEKQPEKPQNKDVKQAQQPKPQQSQPEEPKQDSQQQKPQEIQKSPEKKDENKPNPEEKKEEPKPTETKDKKQPKPKEEENKPVEETKKEQKPIQEDKKPEEKKPRTRKPQEQDKLAKTELAKPKQKTSFEIDFGSTTSTESANDFNKFFEDLNRDRGKNKKKPENKEKIPDSPRTRRKPAIQQNQQDSFDDLLDDAYLTFESDKKSPKKKKFETQPISTKPNKSKQKDDLFGDSIDDLLNDDDFNANRPTTARRNKTKSAFGFDQSSHEQISTDDLFGSSFDFGDPKGSTSPIKSNPKAKSPNRSRTSNIDTGKKNKSPFGFDMSTNSENMDEDELYNAIMNS